MLLPFLKINKPIYKGDPKFLSKSRAILPVFRFKIRALIGKVLIFQKMFILAIIAPC